MTKSIGPDGSVRDRNGDGVAELEESALDFQGGDARNVGAVGAEQVTVGPWTGGVTSVQWDRPELVDSDTTVLVPDDEPTPQDAFRKVPRRLGANYEIKIDETGDYSDEDWYIPPAQSEELYDATQGGGSRLTITRQGGSGTLNPNSVYAIGGRGQGSTVLEHVHPVGLQPDTNENPVIAVFGGEGVKLFNCGIGGAARSGTTTGVLGYTGKVKVEGSFDWGTDLLDFGTQVKQGGFIQIDNTVTASGSVTDNAHRVMSGRIEHAGIGPTSTNEFAVDERRAGGSTTALVPTVTQDGTRVDQCQFESDGDLRAISDDGDNLRMKVVRSSAGDSWIEFYDIAGNKTARLEESGNLVLAGSVTENGSP